MLTWPKRLWVDCCGKGPHDCSSDGQKASGTCVGDFGEDVIRVCGPLITGRWFVSFLLGCASRLRKGGLLVRLVSRMSLRGKPAAGLAALGLLSPLAASASPSLALAEASSADEQVTSISQISDVKPTDWACQTLSALVETYGCVAGHQAPGPGLWACSEPMLLCRATPSAWPSASPPS